MSEMRELKRQVKAEAKAFKKLAKESSYDVSMAKQIDTERKNANRVYRNSIKELRRLVKNETAAHKALLN